jgi:mono/diheme cytochrome c family protein
MKTFLFFILSFLLLSSLVNANNHFPIARDNKEAVALGQKLYNQNCAACHQPNLTGHKDWKTKLDSDGHRLPPPLNGTGHAWHHSDAMLHEVIKHGYSKMVKNYKGKMMGFGKVLNDTDIDHILAYMKSTWSDDVYQHQIRLGKHAH